MRFPAALLVSAAALAAFAAAPAGCGGAEANATAGFLGPAREWPRCRVALLDAHALWGGPEVYLDGSGACVVRVIRAGGEKRFAVSVPPDEAAALLKLCADADLLAVKPADRPGVPDEGRPRIVLTDAGGRSREASKWANEKAPAFDRVYDALRALEKKTAGLEPEYEGGYQADWKPAAVAGAAWRFLDVPEDESRKARDLNPQIDPRVGGIEVVTKVEPADYREYRDLKQRGKASHEVLHGGFVYYAVEEDLHVPLAGGEAGAASGAYVTVTKRYKAKAPPGE